MKNPVQILTLAILLATSGATAQTSNNWVLNTTQDQVSFYVTNVTSNITNTQSTIVKIHNTNDYQVALTFVVSIKCGKNGAVQQQPAKSVFLAPGDDSSLHTYKICNGGEEVMVLIEQIKVEKR